MADPFLPEPATPDQDAGGSDPVLPAAEGEQQSADAQAAEDQLDERMARERDREPLFRTPEPGS